MALYEWRADLTGEPIFPALRCQLGDLGARALQPRVQHFQSARLHIQRWVLGGYSSGGWILYQWLVYRWLGQASPDWQSDVDCVFTIAAPYKNDHSLINLGEAEAHPRSWRLKLTDPMDKSRVAGADPEDILEYSLQDIHVCSVFSTADTTVWSDGAMLPHRLASYDHIHQQRLHHGLAQNGVHTTLCGAEDVIRSIVSCVDAVLAGGRSTTG